MRGWTVAAVLAMGLARTAEAGTLTLNWVNTSPDGEALDPFVLSVPRLDSVNFTYAGSFNRWQGEEPVETLDPFDATLISWPGSPFYSLQGSWNIRVNPAGVKLGAWFNADDSDEYLGSKYVWFDINQGQYVYGFDGYWTATYVAGSPEEGQSFEVLAPIPLPASAPLLGLALAGLGWLGRRRREV